MVRRERRVKRLDAERGDVRVEARRRHQRERAEAADVAVVEVATIRERERDAEEAPLALRQRALVEEQGAGEPRLHDEAVARRQVEHDELRAPPRALDAGA